MRTIERLIGEAGGDMARLVDLVGNHPWGNTVFPDLGRNLADLDTPFPQPGTWQEVEWAWNRGLFNNDVMERAVAARYRAVTTAG